MVAENNVQAMVERLKLLSKEKVKWNYIVCYFERLLPQFTLNQDLWVQYIDLMEEKCTDEGIRIKLYLRALKNCFKNSKLWIGYATELEAQGYAYTEIETILKTNQAGIDDAFEIDKFLYELVCRHCPDAASQRRTYAEIFLKGDEKQ